VQKITSINKKHGPFDLVLCSGDIIPPNLNLSTLPTLPIPLYFIQGKLPVSQSIKELLKQNSIGDYIYLGDCGIYKSAEGLTVGYYGGGVDQVNMEVFNKQVDFLITYEWPLGIQEGGKDIVDSNGNYVDLNTIKGSKIVTEITGLCQPRYFIMF
jgi:hypothetical protein